MKKMFPVLMCAVLIAGLSGVAFADLTQSAVTRVAYNVTSTVGISVEAPIIQNYQVTDNVLATGPNVDVLFHVHSNSEMLKFTASMTNLYKGDVYHAAYYLVPTKGVKYHCGYANPINGDTELQKDTTFIGGTPINGWDSTQAGSVVMDSGTAGTFSQDCTLSFWWVAARSTVDGQFLELPPGQYSGFVRLTLLVQP
jgi:hypothetical protein